MALVGISLNHSIRVHFIAWCRGFNLVLYFEGDYNLRDCSHYAIETCLRFLHNKVLIVEDFHIRIHRFLC